jgi:hypothetical protein
MASLDVSIWSAFVVSILMVVASILYYFVKERESPGDKS